MEECRVGLDYHIEVERHYYSVPHTLLREKVWARIRRHHRGLPSGQSGRGSYAIVIGPTAHHGA